MKKLMLLLVLIFTQSSWAQSFMIMNNGSILTTDKEGFLYDFGHFAYPHKISLKGGIFFIEENSIIATIDEKGMLYRKYEYIPKNIIGKGINYFLSSEGELYMIDKAGAIKTKTEEDFKQASYFGGNYFFLALDDGKIELVTISDTGEYVRHSEQIMSLSDLVSLGGKYFMNRRGVVHTISAAGEVIVHADKRVGLIDRRGGSFFTDSSGFIYTISSEGELVTPAIPANLSVTNIVRNASHYFIDLQGRLFVINSRGEIYQKEMNNYHFDNVVVVSL